MRSYTLIRGKNREISDYIRQACRFNYFREQSSLIFTIRNNKQRELALLSIRRCFNI